MCCDCNYNHSARGREKKKHCAFLWQRKECYTVDLFADTTLKPDDFFCHACSCSSIKTRGLQIRLRTSTRKIPHVSIHFICTTTHKQRCREPILVSHFIFSVVVHFVLVRAAFSSHHEHEKKKALFVACILATTTLPLTGRFGSCHSSSSDVDISAKRKGNGMESKT